VEEPEDNVVFAMVENQQERRNVEDDLNLIPC